MPRGPSGEHSATDVVTCAVYVGRVATGKAEVDRITQPGHVRNGMAEGKARAGNLSAERRTEIAAAAALRRWG